MKQNADNDSGAIRLRSIVLRMHRAGQSDKQISDALDVSEAFVSRTVRANRAGLLGEVSAALSAVRNCFQHRKTRQSWERE
jgi:DNA-binding NarL/FixJ family response regulator